jgi:hypothetical protein
MDRTDRDPACGEAGRAMNRGIEAPYKIFRTLPDGEELFVAGRATLPEAKLCVERFTACWPGKYSIRGPEAMSQPPAVPFRARS